GSTRSTSRTVRQRATGPLPAGRENPAPPPRSFVRLLAPRIHCAMRIRFFSALVATFAFSAAASALTEAPRREHLHWMLKNLPDVPAWREWQTKTGELPPDFDALPSVNALPDPFTFADGKRVVKSARDWTARRAEIQALYEKYDIGTVPPKPKLDRVVSVE